MQLSETDDLRDDNLIFDIRFAGDDPSWPCCQNGITHQEYLGQIVHAVEKMLTIQSENSVPPHLFSSMSFQHPSKHPIIINSFLIP